ncbi:hypothetical protein PG997_015432 [Apiospora hydei]|uniref:Uncharacterized protein n=1 Tax=Apiospora hydei TaxID=1337664 RepID=A0ABR1UQL4_9PEZI
MLTEVALVVPQPRVSPQRASLPLYSHTPNQLAGLQSAERVSFAESGNHPAVLPKPGQTRTWTSRWIDFARPTRGTTKEKAREQLALGQQMAPIPDPNDSRATGTAMPVYMGLFLLANFQFRDGTIAHDVSEHYEITKPTDGNRLVATTASRRGWRGKRGLVDGGLPICADTVSAMSMAIDCS